jgi:dTDP-glucose 4,6-dehydratase
LRVGSEGTRHALDLAQGKGARFLLASTSETYGDPQVHPQPESYWGHVNPVGPRGVYDEAKRFAEAMTMAYRRTLGTDTSIARIFNTYGPRMRPDDGRAIPTFITQALRGEPLTVAGDGEQTRSVCFVDDQVAGLLALLDAGHPGPMNIGNAGELSVLKLAELVISTAASHSPIVFVARPEDDPSVRRPDISLAAAVLGWQPRVPVEEGIRLTVEWFRQHPDLRDITA